MTKYIQVNNWNSFPSNQQEQINEWISQILDAKLAAHNLLKLLSEAHNNSENLDPVTLELLENDIDRSFIITDAVARDAAIGDEDEIVSFCTIVCDLVCGEDGVCQEKCRRVCP